MDEITADLSTYIGTSRLCQGLTCTCMLLCAQSLHSSTHISTRPY